MQFIIWFCPVIRFWSDPVRMEAVKELVVARHPWHQNLAIAGLWLPTNSCLNMKYDSPYSFSVLQMN